MITLRLVVWTGLVAVIAAGCSATTAPSSAPPVASSTTEAPAVPSLDDPRASGDPAVEALCVALGDAVVAGDDTRTASVLVALAAAVRASPAGTEQGRESAARLLEGMANGDVNTVEAGEALAIVAGDLGVTGCEEIPAFMEPSAPTIVPDLAAAALDGARDHWAQAGYGDGDYTLYVFAESSSWFGPGGAGTSVDDCGLFGEWVVLVSAGTTVSVRDRFTGCVVDTSNALFAGIPLTVDEMFDAMAADPSRVRVEYGPLGVPRWFIVYRKDVYVSMSVEKIVAGHPGDASLVLEQAAAQRAIWEAAGVDDYTITIRRGCFCAPEVTSPYTVTVRSGRVESVMRNGGEVELEGFAPATVADLFAAVESAAYADSIVVSYDTRLGYPARIEVDPVAGAVDDEYVVEVVGMVPDS